MTRVHLWPAAMSAIGALVAAALAVVALSLGAYLPGLISGVLCGMLLQAAVHEAAIARSVGDSNAD